ncbi:MAG: hypothetical protein Aurels2KO_58570 [Aureliella sp.]
MVRALDAASAWPVEIPLQQLMQKHSLEPLQSQLAAIPAQCAWET